MFPWQSHPTEEQIAAARAARQRHLAEHEAAIRRLIEQSHENDQWRAEQARGGDDFAEELPPGRMARPRRRSGPSGEFYGRSACWNTRDRCGCGWLGELDGLDEVAPGFYRAKIDPANRWTTSGP